MKYVATGCAVLLLSGCAVLSQEHYDELMSIPPKMEQLEKKVIHLEEGQTTTRIKLDAVTDPKEDLSQKTAKALSDSMSDEIRDNKVSVHNTAPRTVKIIMQQQVLFATGSSKVSKEGAVFLKKFSHVAQNIPDGAKIRIVGHSDNRQLTWEKRQIFKDNLGLSKARAEAVKTLLIKDGGLAEGLLVAEGRGAAEPIGNNGTREGRAMNRRIEIFVENM